MASVSPGRAFPTDPAQNVASTIGTCRFALAGRGTRSRHAHTRSAVRHRRNAGRLQLPPRARLAAGVRRGRASTSSRGASTAASAWTARTLLEELMPDDADDDVTAAPKDLHSRYYQETATCSTLLPGARRPARRWWPPPACRWCWRRRRRRTSWRCCARSSTETTSSRRSRRRRTSTPPSPNPTSSRWRCERADVDADRAVFVGDSVWDVRAAARAGVPCIGVESGGIDRRAARRTRARSRCSRIPATWPTTWTTHRSADSPRACPAA